MRQTGTAGKAGTRPRNMLTHNARPAAPRPHGFWLMPSLPAMMTEVVMPQKRPCSKTPHKPLSSAAALGGRGAVMDASTSLVRGHCPVGAARGAGRGRGAKARGGGVPPPLARRRSACRKRRRRCRGLREVVRGGSRGRAAPYRRMRRAWRPLSVTAGSFPSTALFADEPRRSCGLPPVHAGRREGM